MSGWIKFDKDMANDPRLLEMAVQFAGKGNALANALPLARHALLGALVTLWCYADEHIRDDDSLELSTRAVDALVGIAGFCDLMPADWLVPSQDSCRVYLPGYCDKNSLISKRKRREQGAARQRQFKKRQRERNASGNALPDASAGSRPSEPQQPKGNGVTNASARAVDQDQDLDIRTTHTQSAGKETEARQEITAAAALAIPLRKAGVQITSMHPLCIAWSKEFTVEQAMQAVAVARQNIEEPEAIPAKYLDKVLRNPPRPSASRNGKAHASTPAAPRPKSPVELANEALERAVRDGKTDAQILRELGDQGVDIGWIRIKREECAA